jgi:hypothetical protein
MFYGTDAPRFDAGSRCPFLFGQSRSRAMPSLATPLPPHNRHTHRTYSRKSPAHGTGLEALCAAVVLSFLRSAWCGEMLEFLDLPDRSTLLAQLRAGLSPEIVADLGRAPDESPPRRAKINLAVQPMLFVL